MAYSMEYTRGYDQGYEDGQGGHCERDHYPAVWEIAQDYLRQIRMGYTLDVTLRDVLEEIERMLR